MQALFAGFFDWMAGLPPGWAYLALFLVAYGENVAPPIPGDLVVVFGGYLAGTGQLNLAVVVLLATLGGAAGFMTMYAIGRRLGEAVLDERRYRWIPKGPVHRVSGWLQRWGYGVVAANRFLSGARSVISLMVGVSRTHAGKTAAYATLSALVWTALIGYGGYAVGDNWAVVGEYIAAYGRALLALTALGAALWLGVRMWRRRRGR